MYYKQSPFENNGVKTLQISAFVSHRKNKASYGFRTTKVNCDSFHVCVNYPFNWTPLAQNHCLFQLEEHYSESVINHLSSSFQLNKMRYLNHLLILSFFLSVSPSHSLTVSSSPADIRSTELWDHIPLVCLKDVPSSFSLQHRATKIPFTPCLHLQFSTIFLFLGLFSLPTSHLPVKISVCLHCVTFHHAFVLQPSFSLIFLSCLLPQLFSISSSISVTASARGQKI